MSASLETSIGKILKLLFFISSLVESSRMPAKTKKFWPRRYSTNPLPRPLPAPVINAVFILESIAGKKLKLKVLFRKVEGCFEASVKQDKLSAILFRR